MNTPLNLYREKIQKGYIQADQKQMTIVLKELNTLHAQLLENERRATKWTDRIKRLLFTQKPIIGLYLWGPVGSGKTLLIDLLYHCAPRKKMRRHFHAFMQYVHSELARIQGTPNPLEKVASHIAERASLLCLDELLVTNIADAMILGKLLQALFRNDVCLITTSNTHPDELYKNGIQRERFLTAITAIHQHLSIIQLNTGCDYRRKKPLTSTTYHTPLDEHTLKKLVEQFDHFSKSAPYSRKPIEILGRPIAIIRASSGVLWADFQALCDRPRATEDYLTLAKCYHTFIIGNVPLLHQLHTGTVLSFIHLIDVLYDTKKRLILSATAPLNELYKPDSNGLDFKRTISRLTEMQSLEGFFL